MRERWPVQPSKRRAIVKALIDAATNENARERDRIAAARALLMADKLNLEFTKDAREHDGTERTVRDVVAEGLERLANHVPAEPPEDHVESNE